LNRSFSAVPLPLLLLLACLPLLGGCGDPPKDGSEDDISAVLAEAETDPYAEAGPTGISFKDVTAEAGITAVNHSGRAGLKEFLVEAVGPGAAWFDYDNDGLLDIYIPDGDVFSNYELAVTEDPQTGRTRPYLKPIDDKKEVFRDSLWRNNGDGTFTNVAEQAGIDEQGWSFGATPFDYNADGHTDVFVSNFGLNVLWRNNGDGTFTDIAEAVGLQGDSFTWSTAAAVGDIDGDGRVDIYVAAYSDPAVEVERLRVKQGLQLGVPVESISGRDCRWRAVPAYCGPIGLRGQFDTFYRQGEDGTYENVTDVWGLRPRVGLYAFTCLMFDFNEDGLLDIYVANDSVENYMWQQERDAEGRIHFRETSDTLGIKVGNQISPQASMGMAVADINQDERLDIFVTNFSHDYNNIYIAKLVGGAGGAVYYKDRGLQTMGQQVYYDLSWGCGWYDFDNDKDLDLYVANGHVYKEIDLFEKTGASYEQLNALFENMDPKTLGFREIGKKAQLHAAPETNKEDLYAGDGMEVAGCSRQAAFGDFNNDGLMDILVMNMNEPPTVLLNTSKSSAVANWVKISLKQPGGNRDGLGAIVEVRAGGLTQRIPVVRQKSFCGCDDPRLNVGLGAAGRCDVRVIWPGQERESSEFLGLQAGAYWQLNRKSGKAVKMEMPTFEMK